jgi:hypothetical protein
LYEGNDPGMTRLPIYTLKLLGCEIFFATSAVGSLRESSGPGSFVRGRRMRARAHTQERAKRERRESEERAKRERRERRSKQ